MLPPSVTRYDDYSSYATHGTSLDANTAVSLGMVDAINDPAFFIDVASRTEVKVEEWELVSGVYQVVRVLWGGVVSSVDTERQGDSFTVQRVECSDYTALLDELVIRDYNAPTASESLSERATISGLTTEVIAGGSTLTAGAYTFRVVAYNAGGDILDIFTHVTQNLSATDVTPPGISGTALRTIRLDWTAVAGVSTYKIFAKTGIGTKDLFLKATISDSSVTHSMSTAPAVSGEKSPEDRVQKGSIDIDVVKGSTDSQNVNYKGIFNAIDPTLDPGINNQTAYVETAKKLTDGSPDPDKSYRFSPTLETGIVLTSPFGGKTLKQALSMITEKTGSVFWVDAEKNLHYTNKQARELLENPRFESTPASTGYSIGANHSLIQDRGPYGYGRALIASSAAGTTTSRTSEIPVTANYYYFAKVRGWASANFADHWNAELVFYSNAGGTTQTGASYPLERTSSFSSTDEARWCKTWAMAQAPANAVSARIVVNKKVSVAAECGWTDFSIVGITGVSGFSDLPSETAYALPMRSFETPKAPRSSSKVANRLLVYGVYKNLKNPSELESIETDISLTLRKIQAGSLPEGKYYVRVVAVVGGEDIICTYATETLTTQDFLDGNKELLASWGAVAGASSYKIYVGTKRFAMRLKATQAGTTLSIQTPASGGAEISPEPEVYYYKVFDFSPGIWESGGKIVEASINDSLVDNEEKAETRAVAFWEEKGISEKTWEFDTFFESVPAVGEIIPFIWGADDTAEPLMVKGVKGRLYGDRVYYTVTVGDDPLLTKRGVTQIFADMQMATARLNDVIAPEAPRGLALTSDVNELIQTPDGATRASVTAQWIPSPEDDFSHYSVEYGYDEIFVEVQRSNISQTSDSQSSSTGIKANVVHTFQADSGRTLYYRVCAVDVNNNRSQWVEDEVVLPSDDTPCSAPESLNVTSGLKANTLSWSFDFYDPNSPALNLNNTDFSRFRIYRREHNVGSYAAVAETSATQYIDTSFSNYNTGFNYAVTSLDRTGNESGTPGAGAAAGVAYNTNSNVPSQITGNIDIADASITAAKILSLNADSITTGSLTAIAINNGSGTFGVTSLGVLTATSGTIGGYTLASDRLTNNGGGTAQFSGLIDTATTGLAFFAGASDTAGSAAKFSVTNDGAITAARGTIGGYTIATDRLTNASTTGSVKHAGLIDTAADTGLAFFAGATSTAGAGAVFSVTNAGVLSATSATLTGTITATGGTIGGFSINASSLTAGSSGTSVGMLPGTFPFFAGNATASSAPFRVSSSGALSATSATLTNLNVTNSGSIPSLLVNQSNAFGEVAVNTGTAFRAGHWSGSAFTARIGYTSGGIFQVFNGTSGASPTAVFSVTNTGAATFSALATFNGGISGSNGITFTGASTIAGVELSGGDVTANFMFPTQVQPTSNIPMSANTTLLTVSEALSSMARWHQPAPGARFELKRVSSSERYKHTIESPKIEFLEIARRIEPRFFRRNDETSGRRHLGFIAEEVYEAGLLEAVTYWDPGEGPLIDGVEITAVLASALLLIKDLEARVAELEG